LVTTAFLAEDAVVVVVVVDAVVVDVDETVVVLVVEVVDSVVVVELAALDWFTRKHATVPKRSRTQVNFIPMVEK